MRKVKQQEAAQLPAAESKPYLVNRALLPLSLLRDYVPTATTAQEAQEQKLAAVLQDLGGAATESPGTEKGGTKLASAIAKREKEGTTVGKRKEKPPGRFEKWFLSEPVGQEPRVALYFVRFLTSKELVNTLVTCSRLYRCGVELPFVKTLRVSEVVRLGKAALSGSNQLTRGAAKSLLGPSLAPKSKVGLKVKLGLLQGCRLEIGSSRHDGADEANYEDGTGEDGADTVSEEGIEPLGVFFTNVTKEMCVVDKFAVAMDESINDLTIQAFVQMFSRPSFQRLQSLSLEGCAMGVNGLTILCQQMRKLCLPVLSSLNVARNNAQYNGIYKLSSTIATACCPFLQTLQISSNYARAAVFNFFDSTFATKAPFLMKLMAQDNDCDLLDPDVVNILNRGTSTWKNFLLLDLSFNPLGDTGLCKLFDQVLPLNDRVYPTNFKAKIVLESLNLQAVDMSIKSLSYLMQVFMQRDCSSLTSLSVGMNNLDLTCAGLMIEPLIHRKLPNIKALSLPLNLLEPQGVVLFANACTQGALDSLELFDISDVGGNSESILILARAIVMRWTNKQTMIKKLKVLGRTPFAGRSARVIFGQEFLKEIKVS